MNDLPFACEEIYIGDGVPQGDYDKFRGQCKPMSEAAVAADPTLTLVRGHYICPFWGPQQHWWTKKPDGTIHDPTVLQFPSKGMGEYVEFDGLCECSECGQKIREEDAHFDGRHPFCNSTCYGRFIGHGTLF